MMYSVDAVFMVGDTAQAISNGVEFRFKEVRRVIFELCDQAGMSKMVTFTTNYRSHNGILSVASRVIKLLYANFENAADKLPEDTGNAELDVFTICAQVFI